MITLCKVKEALGDRYVLKRDVYDKNDYWVGVKSSESSGFISHTIRTTCPMVEGVLWLDCVLKIKEDAVLWGDGDGYHRSFTNAPDYLIDELVGLKEDLDYAYDA